MSKRPRRTARHHARKQGAPPGTPIYTGDVSGVPVNVHVIDFTAEGCTESDATDTAVLPTYRGEDSVTWIDFDGIHQADQVQAVCSALEIHPLWAEDIVNPAGRAKAELLDDKVLVVTRMVSTIEGSLHSEQVSIVLGKGWVLTFQERPGDVWDALRTRIRTGGGRVRKMGSDYLLHALLDDVVDHYFLALETFEIRVDELETAVIDPESRVSLSEIFALRNQLADFRRVVWPMRESVSALLRLEDDGPLGRGTQPYFRDLYDHVVQVMDILETSRERVVGVYELKLAVTGHRLNDIMKVLTIVSTIFIPMTFIAGVYGMNFKHMPELDWPWAYPAALGAMAATAVIGGVTVYSRRWLS